MYPRLCAIGLALAVTLTGCGSEHREAATLEPSQNTTTISSNPDPAAASRESPEVTASSAAAAAPECKDLKKADPATCEPSAKGDPQAQ
jgi:hypothetical protein